MLRYLFYFSFVHFISTSRIIVFGGSGRVGGSALRYIANSYGFDQVTSSGRYIENWKGYLTKYPNCQSIQFLPVDINNLYELDQAVQSYDIIVNTAGPFQGLSRSVVLESAIRHGKKYIDVCDDIKLSKQVLSETNQQQAESTGSIAIISAGIWPGGSSLLCQELINRIGGKEVVDKVVFSFFTAGSGGAGPTILTATFLILGEDVLTYVNGQAIYEKSASNMQSVYFGNKVGYRDVIRLNLIECESCYQSGVRNVETYFGTAPKIWNRLFIIMANLFPQQLLQNRNAMKKLGYISLPLVRLIDNLVGSTNGIRIDITTKSGKSHQALLVHEDMEDAVGISLLKFVEAVDKQIIVPPGIYFPEKVPGNEFRKYILDGIASTSIEYSMR